MTVPLEEVMEDISETRRLINELLAGTDVSLPRCEYEDKVFYYHDTKPQRCRLYHIQVESPDGEHLHIRDIWPEESDGHRTSRTPVFNRVKHTLQERLDMARDVLQRFTGSDL